MTMIIAVPRVQREYKLSKEEFRQMVEKITFNFKNGLYPEPSNMKSDYWISMYTKSLYGILSGSVGHIIDKKGNVYILVDGSVGLGVALYKNEFVGYGFFAGAKETPEDYKRVIEGFSFGGGGAVILTVSVAYSMSSKKVTAEVGTTVALSSFVNARQVGYVFNLNKLDEWIEEESEKPAVHSWWKKQEQQVY